MQPDDSVHEPADTAEAWRWIKTSVVLLAFLAVAGFLIFSEHRAHVLGSLIYLLPLVCIVMHLFMHCEHGSHSTHRHDNRGATP
jgi:flagellar biogenesis protein FliO